MIRRWLALTYYLYALRLAALSHFYFNPLYKVIVPFRHPQPQTHPLSRGRGLGRGQICRHAEIKIRAVRKSPHPNPLPRERGQICCKFEKAACILDLDIARKMQAALWRQRQTYFLSRLIREKFAAHLKKQPAPRFGKCRLLFIVN